MFLLSHWLSEEAAFHGFCPGQKTGLHRRQLTPVPHSPSWQFLSSILESQCLQNPHPHPSKKTNIFFTALWAIKGEMLRKYCQNAAGERITVQCSCDKQFQQLRHPTHRPSNQCHMICSLIQSAFFFFFSTVSTEFLSEPFYVEEDD